MNIEEIKELSGDTSPIKRSEITQGLLQTIVLVRAMADGLSLQGKEEQANIAYAVADAYEVCGEMIAHIEVLD